MKRAFGPLARALASERLTAAIIAGFAIFFWGIVAWGCYWITRMQAWGIAIDWMLGR